MAALARELGIDLAVAQPEVDTRTDAILRRVARVLASASDDDLDAFVGQVAMWERALGLTP